MSATATISTTRNDAHRAAGRHCDHRRAHRAACCPLGNWLASRPAARSASTICGRWCSPPTCSSTLTPARYPIAYHTKQEGDTTYILLLGHHHDHKPGQPPVVVAGILVGRRHHAARDSAVPLVRGKANWAIEPYTGYNYNTSYIGHGEDESIPQPAKMKQIENPSQDRDLRRRRVQGRREQIHASSVRQRGRRQLQRPLGWHAGLSPSRHDERRLLRRPRQFARRPLHRNRRLQRRREHRRRHRLPVARQFSLRSAPQ